MSDAPEMRNRLPVVGALLAGGRSRRMGRPKTTLELGGKPLMAYPLEALAGAPVEIVVVAKEDTPLPAMNVPVWREPAEPVHPLLGIVTALERSDGRPVLAAGCDMPFVTSELVAWLASFREPLVVPATGGRLQPLLARYDPVLLEPLRAALAAERAMHEAILELDPWVVAEDELIRFATPLPEELLLNVNTPEDLARAEEILARRTERSGGT